MPTKAITLAVTTLILTVLAIGIISSSMYKVDQTEYALHLKFGKVIHVRMNPGLYPKAPFIDTIQRIDKRTLRADIPPREVPDKDKERLLIDAVIRYQITDPLAFRETLRNEATAHQRLQNIVYSAMRDTIARHDRTDIIGARPKLDKEGQPIVNDEGIPIYESLVHTRDRISSDIQTRIAQSVASQGYGITIISADIKRADFPPQVRSSIIDRLREERNRVAARHRADGEEEYRKRTASVQADADILITEARRDARQTRGQGDAEAIKIVREALETDPEFYLFLRTLESYQTSIQPGSTLILTDEEGSYLNTLSSPPKGQTPAAPPASNP